MEGDGAGGRPLSEPANVGTTIVAIPSSVALPEKPTDHPDRPINNKPNPTTSAATTAPPAEATQPPGEEELEQGDGTHEASSTASTSSPSSATSAIATPSESFLLPSIFPTFGVSPRTQIWIYGAIGTILVFCIALGAYFWWSRRRRAALSGHHADYEFEVLRDVDELDEGVQGKGPKRGRELYDAFAGESDEEFFSDEASVEYKDEEDEGEKRMMLGGAEGEPRLNEKA